jgi:hypothetical protein
VKVRDKQTTARRCKKERTIERKIEIGENVKNGRERTKKNGRKRNRWENEDEKKRKKINT